jgi:hypothetical protein
MALSAPSNRDEAIAFNKAQQAGSARPGVAARRQSTATRVSKPKPKAAPTPFKPPATQAKPFATQPRPGMSNQRYVPGPKPIAAKGPSVSGVNQRYVGSQKATRPMPQPPQRKQTVTGRPINRRGV